MAPEIVITIGYFSGIRPGLETGLNRTGDGESGKREVGSGWQRETRVIIALCSRIGQDRMQSQTDRVSSEA